MSEIKIIEKPEDVSYEVIRDVLQRAHQANKSKGINLRTATFTAEEIEEHLGSEGKCFVAMDGSKVAGTVSYRPIKRKSWYINGTVADNVLAGVLPEYKGRHIYSDMYEVLEKDVIANGYDIIVYNTSADNIPIQKFGLSKGFRRVSFFVAEDNDHYSVVFAKWFKKCPYSALKIWFKYHWIKMKTVIRYKPGKIRRFGGKKR